MARKNLSDGQFALTDGAIEAIADNIKKLLLKHRAGIEKGVNGSDDSKLPVNIIIGVDDSESAANFEIRVRYTTETVTDKRVVRGDESNQDVFQGMTMEELAALEKKADEARQQQAAAAGESSDTPPSGDGDSGQPEGQSEGQPEGKPRKRKPKAE
jgi:hypothetical protein